MVRKRLLVPTAALLHGGAVVLLWTAFAFPPPRLLLEYGLPPATGATGRVRTVGRLGTFVEVAPGYCRVDRRLFDAEGDVLGRLCDRVGLPWGTKPRPAEGFAAGWVEIERPFWIGLEPIVTATISAGAWTSQSATRVSGLNGKTVWIRRAFEGGHLRLPTPEELHYAIAVGADPGDVLFELASAGGQIALVPASPWWEGRSEDIAQHLRDHGPNVWFGYRLVWETP